MTGEHRHYLEITEDQPHPRSEGSTLPLRSWSVDQLMKWYARLGSETQTEHAMRITEESRGR